MNKIVFLFDGHGVNCQQTALPPLPPMAGTVFTVDKKREGKQESANPRRSIMERNRHTGKILVVLPAVLSKTGGAAITAKEQ